MRPALACPILAVALGLPVALASCNQNDPVWSEACQDRPEAGIYMGVGQFSYVELDPSQGVFIDSDLQSGDFVWLGVGTQGLDQTVTMSYGIRDNDSGISLGENTNERWPLTYQGGFPPDVLPGSDHPMGLQVFFDLADAGLMNAEQLVGRPITVWANLNDSCHPDPASPVQGALSTMLSGYDFSDCSSCLDQECHADLAACDADCHAIQACLDAYCVNLSAAESSDEALCQSWCQGQHAKSKDAHIAVVTCVQDMNRGALCATQTCFDNPVDGGTPQQFCYDAPPCHPYPIDYHHCLDQVDDPTAGQCSAPNLACTGSSDCAAYQACNDACTTWPACQACASQHPAGEFLYEQWERCVEDTCLAQGWILHIFTSRKPPRQNSPIEKWKAPTSSQNRRFRLKP
jgi:hypothetical protein